MPSSTPRTTSVGLPRIVDRGDRHAIQELERRIASENQDRSWLVLRRKPE
jgi:hypothetical protein